MDTQEAGDEEGEKAGMPESVDGKVEKAETPEEGDVDGNL